MSVFVAGEVLVATEIVRVEGVPPDVVGSCARSPPCRELDRQVRSRRGGSPSHEINSGSSGRAVPADAQPSTFNAVAPTSFMASKGSEQF